MANAGMAQARAGHGYQEPLLLLFYQSSSQILRHSFPTVPQS
eukprot:CAMPEP_0206613086 /NCGR_PEP_ID=MMETSP0325_2-20121206/56452_1 /ASSEMBLY_ACC=CAM_ASM_000347 /TAXON_ID=2866 /ORGANISM="Crypthecodinium cohnii, Strain Seligo" /LENGTH=41 /DNA_ID= /DNA_START= /DNA_END= /DNA_ORIENTATION=